MCVCVCVCVWCVWVGVCACLSDDSAEEPGEQRLYCNFRCFRQSIILSITIMHRRERMVQFRSEVVAPVLSFALHSEMLIYFSVGGRDFAV